MESIIIHIFQLKKHLHSSKLFKVIQEVKSGTGPQTICSKIFFQIVLCSDVVHTGLHIYVCRNSSWEMINSESTFASLVDQNSPDSEETYL